MKLKLYKRLSYWILGLLGFATACDIGNSPDMYGTPSIKADISGKVTDTLGQPVAGIKVSMGYGDRLDTLTSADGSYEISGRSGAFAPGGAVLIFTDIDGPDNGGEFIADTVQVTFSEADRTGEGDGSWYGGTFARTDVDVQLQAAEQPDKE